MRRGYSIGLDVHEQSTEIAMITQGGKLSRRQRCRTTVVELAAALAQVRRPRWAVMWKYLGIGLERRTSGRGPVQLRVARNANRVLETVILGAAKSAVRSGENPFADQR